MRVKARQTAAGAFVAVDFMRDAATLQQYVGGQWTTLATNTAVTTAPNVDYDVRVVCDGDYIEVWRAVPGTQYERILQGTTTLLASAEVALAFAGGVPGWDLVSVRTDEYDVRAHDYNAANELTATYTLGDTRTYTYDPWGRTTRIDYDWGSDGSVDAHEAYTWRWGDKLHRVETSNMSWRNANTEMLYNGLGQRVRQTIDGGAGGGTWWRWSGWEEAASHAYDHGTPDTVGTRERTFFPGLGEVLGSSPAAGGMRHYLSDHLGSPRGIAGQDGALIEEREFLPYGNLRAGSASLAGLLQSPAGYTGHHWDANVQQYFAPFRYYGLESNRWLKRDPLGMVDGPNMYGFVGGDAYH